MKEHKLVNVSEPNLLRDMFPYSSVPKVAFDGKKVDMEIPEDIFITDTTFRDGQQSRPPYTADQMVDIFKFLSKIGGKKGVIRQSEFFLYTEKDREAVRKCQDLGYAFPEITGWIRAVKDDFKLVKEMGLKETGILTSCSDYHIYLKLKKDRRQALESYLDIVRTAIDSGVKPRCHFEDLTRADFWGFVIPFSCELMKIMEETKVPVKIRVCDTMGYGVPWEEAELPRSVPKIFSALRKEAGVPAHLLEWHGHNDFHKVLVDASTAWLYGCGAANGTLLGFGERTGNPPIEGLIMDYISITGRLEDVDTTAITDMAEYFTKVIGYQIPPNFPFVGRDCNVTKAGIHADGLLKNEEIYNIFDTTKLLKKPIGIAITDKSGVAGIAHWIANRFDLKGDKAIDKRHPGIAAIYDDILKMFEGGRLTSVSDEEMLALVNKHMDIA